MKKIEDLKEFVLLKEESIEEEKTEGATKKSKTRTHRKQTFAIEKKVF